MKLLDFFFSFLLILRKVMSHELNRNKYDVISMCSFPWCSFANISPKQMRLSSAPKHGLRARTSFTLVPGFSLPGQALPGHSSLLLRPALYPLPSFVSKFLEAEYRYWRHRDSTLTSPGCNAFFVHHLPDGDTCIPQRMNNNSSFLLSMV